MKQIDQIEKIIQHTEQILSWVYGFSPCSSVANHIVSKQELMDSLGKDILKHPEFHSRAGVFLCSDVSQDDLYIGVHVDHEIQSILNSDSPLKSVHLNNLDPFWVIIEEISHFHLILNRASHQQKVTKLELEWQGEIDKVLVSALTLMSQHGDPCLHELLHLLHESSIVTSTQDLMELYSTANLYAARFWQKVLKKRHPLEKNSLHLLRQFYWAPWTYKHQKLS